MAARFHLARPQGEALAKLQRPADRGQRGLAHQFGAGPGQRAFVGTRPAQVKRLGDQQVDHAVAEELQPLVVRRAGAAVGQRLRQQRRIGEIMADPVAALRVFTR
ncbi:hypothetical protein D3C81_2074200 [compost metagenome]